jgi:DNA transposition AAA+ family ATPase
MARQFLGLEDAKTMTTTGFGLSQRCVADCVSDLAMGVVYGPAGVGKTFSVEYASENAKISPYWFTFTKQPALTHMVKAMLEKLTGIAHRGERFKLTSDLVQVLAEKPRLIVVDEAQQLNANALDYLRYLHDEPNTQFALMFVGGNGCWKTLSRHPMLLSRVYRQVRISALDEEEVMSLMPKYHPIHAGVSLETLLEVNECFASGNFRRWASFTHTIVRLCGERKAKTYNSKLAAAALSLLPEWNSRAA